MSVPTSPSLVEIRPHLLEPALIGDRQEAERGPAAHPAQAQVQAEPPVKAETRPSLDFKEVVRANTRAAAQHTILGHKAPSFRECSHPSCQNASNLIPHPVVMEGGVTDADLEEIFQRIVPAALEEAVSTRSQARTASESQGEPAFVS